jgi:hypothetical protein
LLEQRKLPEIIPARALMPRPVLSFFQPSLGSVDDYFSQMHILARCMKAR